MNIPVTMDIREENEKDILQTMRNEIRKATGSTLWWRCYCVPVPYAGVITQESAREKFEYESRSSSLPRDNKTLKGVLVRNQAFQKLEVRDDEIEKAKLYDFLPRDRPSQSEDPKFYIRAWAQYEADKRLRMGKMLFDLVQDEIMRIKAERESEPEATERGT